MTTSVDLDEDAIKIWHMRLDHVGEKFIQALAKQGLSKGAKTCRLKFCEHCVLSNKIKVKFGTIIYRIKGILDYVYTNVSVPFKTCIPWRKILFYLLC